MSEPDLLFTVRNNFYLGAYQSAIAEASDLEGLGDAQKTERDVYVYRSYIELGSFELVINEVSSSEPMALQAVKLLAQYIGKKLDKTAVLSTLSDWLQDSACNNNPFVLGVAGIIYANEEDYAEALKACHTGLSMEMLALSVQIYLKMDRVDQAEKVIKVMSSQDDDDTLTQLATAWVDLFLGGSKVREALTIYQELGDRFNWTVRLYNGAAVCNMRMEQFEDAEKMLQEALEKDAKNPDTLANLVTCGLHLGKPVSRHSNQLKTVAPTHFFIKRQEDIEDVFSRAAASFEIVA